MRITLPEDREPTRKEKVFDFMSEFAVGRALIGARRELRKVPRKARKVKSCGYTFIDRSRGCENVCIILAGYKEQLWDVVFDRIEAYLDDDIDVCIMTSGLTDQRLMDVAQTHGWSYLSTEVNHLSHIQNVAIELHPHAKWIYKLDEDMFITEGFFGKLYATYERVVETSSFLPAFVAPLINVNCYGHLRILERLGLMDDFATQNIAPLYFGDGIHRNKQALENPAVARYMWGETQPVLADIDELSARFAQDGPRYSVTPFRFSIGAILMAREVWEEFGKFPITFVGSEYGIGDDEEYLCDYAYEYCRAMVVSEDLVVGHLGYGGAQTAEMLAYFEKHKRQFQRPEMRG